MPRHDPVPEPWFSFLKELDALVATTVRLDCIGGFVITMLYGLSRPTADLDVLEIAPLSAATTFAQVAMQGGELYRSTESTSIGLQWPKRHMSMRAV